jgi:hypothetical protein
MNRLKKEERNDESTNDVYRDLSILGTLAVNSSKKHSLKVIENGIKVPMRPFTSVLVRAPIGNTKSTFLNVVARHGKKDGEPKRKILTEITRAGLVGAIDTKSQNFVPVHA